MRIVILFMVFSSFQAFSQKDWKLYCELSQFAHLPTFTESNLSLGVPFKYKKLSIIPTLHYQFGGKFRLNPSIDYPAYNMNYHLLGLGTKFRFRESNSYCPSVGFTVLKEIKSNYFGKYLKSTSDGLDYSLVPTNSYSIDEGNGGSPNRYYVAYYVSTPLLVNISFGNEFRITKELFVNFGIGYSTRAVKGRRKSWFEGSPEPKASKYDLHSLQDVQWKHFIDLSLGINYSFPLSKKKK